MLFLRSHLPRFLRYGLSLGPRTHQIGKASCPVSQDPPAFASPVLRLGAPPCHIFFVGVEFEIMLCKVNQTMETSLECAPSCVESNVKKDVAAEGTPGKWKDVEKREEAAEEQGGEHEQSALCAQLEMSQWKSSHCTKNTQ